jgi:hypothetical protein
MPCTHLVNTWKPAIVDRGSEEGERGGDEEEVDDIGRTVQLGVLFVAKPRPAQPNISARDTERVSCYERDTKNMKMTKKQTETFNDGE